MRQKSVYLTLAALGLLLLGCRQPQPISQAAAPTGEIAGDIRVYIPCGMIIPMRAAIDAFKLKHPGVTVTGVYDNAGIIVKRLAEKKEPADVVVTPGETEMAMLEKAGLMDPGSRQSLGSFELVCIVPAAGKLAIAKPEDLKQCKTIAMPNPDVNSTGTSGRDALTKLGLYDTLKPKMILPNHAIEAHTMVAGGKADAGIAYRNCPLETNPEKLAKSKVRIAFSFPADSYTQQPLLIAATAQAANRPAADALLAFISSPEGLQILADNGMTGCLEMGACSAPAASAQPADVEVVAYYPGDEKHVPIRKLIESLPRTYGPRVSGRFVDFTSDEGFKEWHDEKGLSCGAILINDEQVWTYEKDGQVQEVTFKMAIDGEWTANDLHAVIKKLLKQGSSQQG